MATNMPSNPAPVSGPGALSQRTDGGPADKQPIRDMPGGAYGEGKEMQQIQAGADMYAQPQTPAPPAPGGMFDPTGRPDEPITSGVASGPGVGPSMSEEAQDPYAQDMAIVAQYLPSLRRAAEHPSATNTFKSVVRYLETFNG